MDQGGVVNELDRHRCPNHVVQTLGTAETSSEEDQRRPEPLAAGLENLLHRVRNGAEVGAHGRVQPLLEVLQLGSDRGDEIDPGHCRAHAAPSRPLMASTSSSRTVPIGGRPCPNRIRATSVKRSGEPVT